MSQTALSPTNGIVLVLTPTEQNALATNVRGFFGYFGAKEVEQKLSDAGEPLRELVTTIVTGSPAPASVGQWQLIRLSSCFGLSNYHELLADHGDFQEYLGRGERQVAERAGR